MSIHEAVELISREDTRRYIEENLALKVPSHEWEVTVAFYRDTLGLPELETQSEEASTVFAFGAMRLWFDRVETGWRSASDVDAAAEQLAGTGMARRDDIEPLGDSPAFWISGPGNIIHLVSPADAE